MAKRIGNVSTVQNLREQGVSAAALRHFVFSTHYRKQINLSAAALEASVEAVARVGEFAYRLETELGGTPELASEADRTESSFRAALDEDLNAPEALASLFSFIQRANSELDRHGMDVSALERAKRVFSLMDGVLDIRPRALRFVVGSGGVTPDPMTLALPAAERESVLWAIDRLSDRSLARRKRDFQSSDAIRAEVEARGFLVKDTPTGAVLARYS
jgi:cysteinyl-tRNA synthetase